jgi:hypothetical protein
VEKKAGVRLAPALRFGFVELAEKRSSDDSPRTFLMSKRERLEPTQVFLPSIYDFPVLDHSLEPWTQQTIDRMIADLDRQTH